MDDRDFFDVLMQMFSKTTGAEDRFWQPEEYTDHSGRWNVYAVHQEQGRKLVASGLTEIDADFVTAIHGCLPDLVRRLHMAVDESDALDIERDELVNRVAELERESDLSTRALLALEAQVTKLETELADANDEVDYLAGKLDSDEHP